MTMRTVPCRGILRKSIGRLPRRQKAGSKFCQYRVAALIQLD